MSYWSDHFTEITPVSSAKCSKTTSEGEIKESSVTTLLKHLPQCKNNNSFSTIIRGA